MSVTVRMFILKFGKQKLLTTYKPPHQQGNFQNDPIIITSSFFIFMENHPPLQHILYRNMSILICKSPADQSRQCPSIKVTFLLWSLSVLGFTCPYFVHYLIVAIVPIMPLGYLTRPRYIFTLGI